MSYYYFKTEHIDSVKNFVAQIEASKEYKEATVYNKKTGIPQINPQIRKGQKIVFKSRELQDLIQEKIFPEIVRFLSKSNIKVSYLNDERDHFDLIKYEPGEYFMNHKDIMVGKRGYAQYTMLISLTSVGGGKTRLYSNINMDFDTNIEGFVLLFRPYINHAGLVVNEGTKKLLMTTIYIREEYESAKYSSDDDWCNGWELED